MVMKKRDRFEAKRTRKQDDLSPVYVDDFLMTLKYYVDEEEAHLWIKDFKICHSCEHKPCLYFCPAGVYSLGSDGTIQIAFQSCVECGCCRVGCPYDNIGWKLPRGGFGVAYKFG